MKKKILITIGIILAILVIGGGGLVYYVYHSVQKTADNMYDGKSVKPSKENTEKIKTQKPISILLLGVDERKGDVGRSDTMIVLTLNPQKNAMQMISIPRDTRTEIAGKGTMNKINAAYAYGGPKMSLATVNQFANLNLDQYIRINMEGLSDLVDAVGGVTVNNKLDWHDEGYYQKGYHYQKGNITLDTGKKALGYVRMRHLDPQGDFGRNQRQRDVIMAVINKAATIQSFSRYQEILAAIQNNIKTNLTFTDMKDIAMNYRECRNNTTDYEVAGTGGKIGGVYYLNVSEAERQKVHNMVINMEK
ncbi:LCP family protein [Heyndrickxia acidiproducens]|uniref:LCP family glycopolymer transferase n=1 Tax=Heyndrickxia acidiproducens TaxID=1121084 RepID=UPI000371031D|nr:LCP family protein [Heyndrickxia acidiproducens]